MNRERLLEAEALFLEQYPGGFADPAMEPILRKHQVGRLTEQARTQLSKAAFDTPGRALDDIVKLVSRSSMISMFEKPKFRDYLNGMTRDDREFLAGAYRRLLHGGQAGGFADVADVLREAKLAKWSLMTICLFHYRPQKDVFVKPTTTKNVIRRFELTDLVYKPQPTWAFYRRYREAINGMKAELQPSLSPNNAAFTGFLMMTSAVDG